MIRRCLAAALLAATVAQSAHAQTSCDVRLNITDQDPAGLNVRAEPGGAVTGAVKAKDRWVQVRVTAQNGAWARIDGATLYTEDHAEGRSVLKGAGWVAFSKLGIEELRTPSTIFAAASENSRPVLKITELDESKLPKAEVLGCDGDFLQVRVQGVVGWTRNFCANQFTTCG